MAQSQQTQGNGAGNIFSDALTKIFASKPKTEEKPAQAVEAAAVEEDDEVEADTEWVDRAIAVNEMEQYLRAIISTASRFCRC